MIRLAIGVSAIAAACVGVVVSTSRRPTPRPGILPLIAPYIDSQVADEFLFELDRRRIAGPQTIVLHTFGGAIIPCAQIARALLDVDEVTVIVPLRAFSGGTLIALSAPVVAMGDSACFSAVDPIIDNERARHYAAMEDPMLRRNAKEYYSAALDLIESLLDRQGMEGDRDAARELLTGERYPHGWPLTRSMLQAAGFPILSAPANWSAFLEGYV